MLIKQVKLGDDGRIVIPAARWELGLTPGATLVVESDCVSLLVRSRNEVVRETQNYFKQFTCLEGS